MLFWTYYAHNAFGRNWRCTRRRLRLLLLEDFKPVVVNGCPTRRFVCPLCESARGGFLKGARHAIESADRTCLSSARSLLPGRDFRDHACCGRIRVGLMSDIRTPPILS